MGQARAGHWGCTVLSTAPVVCLMGRGLVPLCSLLRPKGWPWWAGLGLWVGQAG